MALLFARNVYVAVAGVSALAYGIVEHHKEEIRASRHAIDHDYRYSGNGANDILGITKNTAKILPYAAVWPVWLGHIIMSKWESRKQ